MVGLFHCVSPVDTVTHPYVCFFRKAVIANSSNVWFLLGSHRNWRTSLRRLHQTTTKHLCLWPLVTPTTPVLSALNWAAAFYLLQPDFVSLGLLMPSRFCCWSWSVLHSHAHFPRPDLLSIWGRKDWRRQTPLCLDTVNSHRAKFSLSLSNGGWEWPEVGSGGARPFRRSTFVGPVKFIY